MCSGGTEEASTLVTGGEVNYRFESRPGLTTPQEDFADFASHFPDMFGAQGGSDSESELESSNGM